MSSLLRTPETEPESPPQQNQITSNLVSISKNVRLLLSLRLAEIGLRAGQDEYLVGMDEVVLRSVSAIAQTFNVRSSTASKLTDDLVAAGLIQRHSGTSGQLTTYVSLTSLGLEKRAKVLAVYATLEAEFLRQFGKGEAAADSAVLRRTDMALRQLTRRIR